MKQESRTDIGAVFLGGDAWSQLAANYQGPEIDGCYYSDHWHPDLPGKANRSFIDRWRREYGPIKSSGTPLSYDAVMILRDAVQRANSLKPPAICDALSATNRFEGVTGLISMNAQGDPRKPVVIVRIDNHKMVLVKSLAP